MAEGQQDRPADDAQQKPKEDAGQNSDETSAEQPEAERAAANDDKRGGKPADEKLDDAEQSTLDDAASFVFNINGNMYAEGSSIGGDRARGGRTAATGTVDSEALDEALRDFVDPPLIGEARAKLLRNNLVLLVGAEGSGRRAGGLALLRSIECEPAPVILSPSLTFASLVEQRFQRNGRYLLADQVSESGATAQRRFDLDRVQDHLRDADAVLVITTTTPAADRGRSAGLAIEWEAVPGEQILDHYLRTSGIELPDESVNLLRERIATLAPDQARRLIDRLEANGVQAALSSAADAAQEKVRGWIATHDGIGHKLHDLLPVVTAAFVHGASRTEYEWCAVMLRSAMDDYVGRTPERGPDNDQTIIQSRARLPQLLCVKPAAGDQFAEPTVATCSLEEHEAVFTELVERHGPELWDPVRQWLAELPVALGPQARLGLGFGLAVLSRVDPAEVRRALDSWADGWAAQRLTAAFTLHWMCQDDRTAPLALRTAIRWCSDAGPQRAVTAAIAFALGLGTVYPSEAISRLWYLALRGNAVAGWARFSLATLVGLTAATDSEGVQLRRAIGIVRRQLHHLLDNRGHDHRAIGKALSSVYLVLAAELPDGEGSLTLFVLRGRPELIDRVGELWSEVLASFPHRGLAISELRDTFDRMYGAEDAAAVQRLGDAVRAQMDEEQWARLRRELPEGQW